MSPSASKVPVHTGCHQCCCPNYRISGLPSNRAPHWSIRHVHCRGHIRCDVIMPALALRRRSLVQQEAAKLDVFGVQRQLREGNCELAAINLSRESELGELRNQIAIVRYMLDL